MLTFRPSIPLARFPLRNFAPQPNAYAKIVNIETNNPKIILFAKRVVEDGEELTYDYQFPIDGEGGTACHCGSKGCTGFLGGI